MSDTTAALQRALDAVHDAGHLEPGSFVLGELLDASGWGVRRCDDVEAQLVAAPGTLHAALRLAARIAADAFTAGVEAMRESYPYVPGEDEER